MVDRQHGEAEAEAAGEASSSLGPSPDGGSGPRFFGHIQSPGAILGILAFINFFNYVDRQVIGPLVPLLQKPEAQGGLGLSNFQVGLLQTAFMVVHSVLSIPMGIVADRYLRKSLIAAGVGVWSIATAGAALVTSFGQMFAARAAVGIGEATYAPAASALISDRFSAAARARALGVFQTGMILGGAAAVVLGSWFGSHFGWRAAFFLVGAPGLLLTLLTLMIYERPRPRRVVVQPRPGLAEARAALLTPVVFWINVAGILISFFVGALIFWAPTYLLRTYYGGDEKFLREVGLAFGVVAATAGLAGTLTGSFVADRLERTRPGSGRLLAVAIGTLLSVPCALAGVFSPTLDLLYVAVWFGVFFNSWYVGPILAALHDVVAQQLRGTMTGVYLLLIHLLGDGFSPAIVGGIADYTGSLRTGLVVAVGVLFLGGLAALLAIRGTRAAAPPA